MFSGYGNICGTHGHKAVDCWQKKEAAMDATMVSEKTSGALLGCSFAGGRSNSCVAAVNLASRCARKSVFPVSDLSAMSYGDGQVMDIVVESGS